MINQKCILNIIKFGNLNKNQIPTTVSLTGTVFLKWRLECDSHLDRM